MRILYTVTLFTCSALLFLVEPMVAKMILPTFGGSPSVWNASMVFFQAALLLGYLYAHLSTRFLGARRQALVHIAVMLVALVALPIAVPNITPEGSSNPALLLIWLLTVAVGLPFFALSAGAPLIQKWFADTDDPAAADPYFLYRASNLGSMVGLLGYPALYERDFTLRQQATYWGFGYLALVVLMAIAVAMLWRSKKPAPVVVVDDAPAGEVTWVARLRWIALAAVPSSLMLGVTTYMTSNLAPVPLLWVVPLALYLITFVIAFSRKPWFSGKLLARILPLIVTPMLIAIVLESVQYLVLLSLAHLLMFFAAALMCHTLLAESRPAAKHLTEFYLWLSVGGMLGGVFNALVAPVAFKTLAEYPIAIVLACLLRPQAKSNSRKWIVDFAYPVVVAALSLGALWYCEKAGIGVGTRRTFWVIGMPAIAAFIAVDRTIRYGLAIGALLLVANQTELNRYGQTVQMGRSFFGVHRVVDIGEGKRQYDHGNTIHGVQNLTPGLDHTPLTYYYPTGPIGQVFEHFKGPKAKKNVALVGLGIGSLAAYGQPGQTMTFFEIDPEVLWMARDSGLFTYVENCRANLKFRIGDARLMMKREPHGEFGIIVLDAFNSDSIPVHLLTREALEMYLEKLEPGGIIAFHISNRYLDLLGVLANAAYAEHLKCLCRDDTHISEWAPGEQKAGKSGSKWVIMARKDADFESLRDDSRWEEIYRDKRSPDWTDDYSNILSVFDRD